MLRKEEVREVRFHYSVDIDRATGKLKYGYIKGHFTISWLL